MTPRTGLAGLGRLGSRRDEGQTIVIVALCMVVFLGMAGLVIDVANLYVTQRHLQTAADAAALAAAQDLPNSSSSACAYSASTAGSSTCTVNGTNVALAANGDNYATTFGNVQTMAKVECVSVASAGTACQTGTACPGQYNPAGTTSNLGCNAIKVTEQTTVTPFFMGVLGFGSQTVTASATAGLSGGTPEPLDVEMIDDTTASMGDADTCGGTPTDVPSTVSLTQEDCAKAGIRALLTTLDPCAQTLASCGPYLDDQTQASGGAVDEVGLVSFPGLKGLSAGSDGSLSNELDCASNVTGSNVSYGLGANYQVVPFSSDFRYSDASTADRLATLNTGSNLVRAVYWPGDGCPNGGYPIQGGSTSSISGGGAADTTTAATASGSTTGGGASTAADTASATNAGITQGKSTATANPSGITQGKSTSTSTNLATIGGGPNSGSGGDTNTSSVSGATAITIARPSTRAVGDFLLLTVTGQAASLPTTSIICPSGTTSGWTPVGTQQVAGTLIQATYSSTRSTAAAENYTFNFFASGACPTPGTALPLTASATVLRYTNIAGIDASNLSSGAPTLTNWSGSTASTGWSLGSFASPTISSTTWSGTHYMSLSTNCESTTDSPAGTGCDNTTVPTTGTLTGLTFNFSNKIGGGGPNATTYTVTLLVGTTAPPTTLTCTVANKTTGCTISGSVPVTAGQTIQLSVLYNGNTVTTDTATASVTEQAAPVTPYISLSTACSSASVATCDVTSAPAAGTLSSASLSFGTNVPAGDSFTVTLLQNGAATSSTCTIAAGTKTCSLPAGLALAANDKLELQVALTSGSVAFAATATTAAVETSGGTSLTAPATAGNTPAGDQVVRLFGTGATSFSGTAPPLTVASGTTATGADDGVQPTTGSSGSETKTTASANDWVAQTVTLHQALASSITVAPPSDYVGGGNDLLLVTISAQNLGAGAICAPAAAPTWNAIATKTSGTLTQSSFWTMSSSPGYTFNLETSSACSGTAVGAGASEVATTFTGVDPTTPLDSNVTPNPTLASGTSSASLAPASITTSSANDEVVGLFATNATSLTVAGTASASVNGTWTSSGLNAKTLDQPGPTTPSSATSTPAANWSEQTVALKPALSSSICFGSGCPTPLPSDYSGNSGDLLLVSIAVQALGSGVICAPADSTWNALAPSSSSGTGPAATAITQETFWTMSSTASTDTFSFKNGSCSGSAATGAANAVATTYDGVDPASPISVTDGGGTGTALSTSVGSVASDDEVVSLFATTDTFKNPSFSAQTSPSSIWTNLGESAAAQLASGSQPMTANAASNLSATWTSQAVVLTPLLDSSITLTPPTNYRGGGGDLLLVSVEAQNLGSGSICAPDGTWNAVPLSSSPTTYTTSSGTLTQEAFYTTASDASSDTFSFYSKAACSGSPLNAGASAVAVMYTGVNPASPLDGTGVAAPAPTTASPLIPAAVTTHAPNDEVVTLYGTAAPTLTGPTLLAAGNSLSPSSGLNNAAVATAGSYTPSQATSSPTASNWTAETIALTPLANDGITLARPASPTSNDFLIATVTASGLGASGNICAPDDGTWSELGQITQAGTTPVTQATFSSARATATPESYTFTFQSVCSTTGTPLPASATAVAVRFNGVNPITPIDEDNTGALIYSKNNNTGTSLTPTLVTPPRTGDEVLTMYGSGATSLSASCLDQVSGSASATGFCDTGNSPPPANQNYTAPTVTSNTSKPWVVQTIALESASGGCGSSCKYGIEDPGGVGTDYGQAIAAAEKALDTEAATRPTARKVIILLSDGDANTTAQESNPCQYGITQAENAEAMNGSPYTMPGNTWVYAIAYGAIYAQGQSCTDDTGGLLHGLSAQCAMELIADNHVTDPAFQSYATDLYPMSQICPAGTYEPSDPAERFYNEATGSSLANVFTQVGDSLSSPRLISNDAS
jgi:hypothetical protein